MARKLLSVFVRCASICFLLLLFIFFEWSAKSRPYNYEDLPLTERTAGLGNSAMALYSDVGNVYYNPAVLGPNEQTQVSASLSAYSRIDTRTGQYVSAFTSAVDNVTRGGFLSIPSMSGGHIKKWGWNLAGVVLVPESFTNTGTIDLAQNSVGSFQGSWSSLWIGLAASKQWKEDRYWGVSLFYINREYSERLIIFENYAGGQTPNIRYQEQSLKNSALATVFGYWQKLSDTWTLGLSVRMPPLFLGGSGFYSEVVSDQALPDVPGKGFKAQDFALPMRLGAGLTWQALEHYLFVTDLKIYSGIHKDSGPGGNEAFRIASKPIMNVSGGVEYSGWKDFAVRLGGFTNFSSAEHIMNVRSVIYDKVNMLGATGSLSLLKAQGSMTFGGYVQGGQGSAIPVSIAGGGAPVPRSNYIYGAYVASSVHF